VFIRVDPRQAVRSPLRRTNDKSRDDASLPTIAIVGRPNVGKSTLFNRLVGQRRALVGDEPGITRDRIYGTAHWLGRTVRIVDTGGIVPEDKQLIPAEIFRQARVALEEASAIILVVDARTELAAPDRDLARLLIKTGKPLFLAVNKVDTPELEAAAENFRELGLRELYAISAEHGGNVAELLDAVWKVLPPRTSAEDEPETRRERAKRERREPEVPADDREPTTDDIAADNQPPTTDDESKREIRVAIIGRPNVGKSTLLNKLTGTSRSIVSPIPGTTRDAVDELVERDGQTMRFVDTAGIRRKGKTELMAEKLSVVMARKHLEASDIALLVIDALEGITALDANIAGYAHESWRSVIVVVNKWDLVLQRAHGQNAKQPEKPRARAAMTQRRTMMRPADQPQYEEELRRGLKFLNYAPVVFCSASIGKGVEKLWPMIEKVAAERRKRIGTGEMNRFLETVDFERASVPVSRRVRILYMTQAGTSPPTFVIFTDRDVKLHFSYERFLENTIRKAFGFEGSPIKIKVKARNPKK
jgi:GTPase